MDVRLPDGRILKNVPEGTTKEQIAAKLGLSLDGQPAQAAAYDPAAEMSRPQRIAAKMGKTAVDLYRGLRQLGTENQPLSLGQASGREAMPDTSAARAALQQEEADARALDAPLMARGGTFENIAAAAPVYALASVIPGAQSVLGATAVGAGIGALQPTVEGESRASNMAVGAVTSAAGQVAANAIGDVARGVIRSRIAAAGARQAENAMRDTTLSQGVKAGFRVPPLTTRPGAMNQLLEGALAGKSSVAQRFTANNQRVTNALAREEIGLPNTAAPISPRELARARAPAEAIYERVKSAGAMRADDQYLADLVKAEGTNARLASSFPRANVAARQQIDGMLNEVLEDGFDAEAAVGMVKELREDAGANLSRFAPPGPGRSAQRALGRAQKQAANALEGLIERNLAAKGMPELGAQFRDARTLFAKIGDVERSLGKRSGNVIASKLASSKSRLTGNLDLIARMAAEFPDAMRLPKGSVPAVSVADTMLTNVGAVASLASGNPGPLLAAMSVPAARVAARETLLRAPRLGTSTYDPGIRALSALQFAGTRVPAAVGVASVFPQFEKQ